MSESKCKSCGATIVWARTINGKTIPLDPELVDGGNIDLGSDGVAYVAPVDALARKRHRSHFASCKFAATHRKTRK